MSTDLPSEHAADAVRPVLAVDIGGTKIAAALVRAGERSAEAKVPTQVGADNGATIAEAVARIASAADPDGTADRIAIAVAGRVSGDGRQVALSANLELVDAPLAEFIEARTGRRARLINDVQASLLAETRFGAARGKSEALMVSLGTGVGGAVMSHGRLTQGAHGNAGEIGHTVVKPGGRRCGCGARGCLDLYGSGRALARFARKAGLKVSLGEAVARHAQEGDPRALHAFAEVAHWVARGLVDAIALLDPEAVVVGGGLADCGDLLMEPLQHSLHTELSRRGYTTFPTLDVSQLGGAAPILGAAQSVLEESAR
ncbi:MAG: ROK family protein [Propionicimonas sp.]